MTDNDYEEINFVHYQRVTYQDMMHLQSMRKLVEGFRQLDALPSVSSSSLGDTTVLNGDKKIYYFDGTQWTTIGDVKLPISDSTALLKNSTDVTKLARFDLSLINPNTTRIFYLPDVSGTIALTSNIPTIGGTLPGAALYRISSSSAGGNNNILIGRSDSDDYVNITESSTHTGEVIRYTDNTAEVDFILENTGRVAARCVCLYSGGDG